MPPTPSYTDSWPTAQSLPSPPKTPTRVSRSNGASNDVPHRSFTRTFDSNGRTVTYKPGQTVIVGKEAVMRQKWLGTPDYLVKKAAYKGKGKKRVVDTAAVTGEGWRCEDGLGDGDKVAVITGLYEDVKGRMMARVRWFARPAAVWGERGPVDGEQVDDYELYYTSDSSYLQETRSRAEWSPGSINRVSLVNRTAMCSDSILISTITRHAEILTPKDDTSNHHRPGALIPSFLVRKVFDAKPVQGAEFIGEIDWIDVFRSGMEEGNWDVEAIMEEDSGHVRRRKKVKTNKGKGKAVLKKPVYTNGSDGSDSENASVDEEFSGSDNGDDDSGSDEGEPEVHSGDEGSDQEESENSDAELDRTPSKKRKRGAPSTPTRRVVPKLTRVAKARAQTRRAKQTKFSKKQSLLDAIPPTFKASRDLTDMSHFQQAKALLHVSATPEALPCREKQRNQISSLLGDAILGQTGTCLYIHGVPGTGKTATVHSIVRELQQDEEMDSFQFVEINGMKIAEPSTAYTLLWSALSGQKAAPRLALSQLENHFQTPDPSRKTTVVLVDELDQMITKKQDVIYNFFNWPHVAHSRLIVLAIANTMDLPERELSGKIRSRLGSNRIVFTPYKWEELQRIMLERLEGLEVFDPRAIDLIAKRVAGGPGDARRALDIARRTAEKVDQSNQEAIARGEDPRLCTMSDASSTHREMTDHGSNVFVKKASLHGKILLLALAQCIKRAGVSEVEADAVMSWHLHFLERAQIEPKPSQTQLFTLLAELHAMRLLVTESQRNDYYQLIRPLVQTGDLFEMLREVPEIAKYVPTSA